MNNHTIKLLLLLAILPVISSCRHLREFRYESKALNSTIIIDSSIVSTNYTTTEVLAYEKGMITTVKTFTKDSLLIAAEKFSGKNRDKYYGESKYWYPNGQLKKVVNCNNDGWLDGKVTTYHNNGKLKRDDIFRNGDFQSGKCYDSSGAVIEHYPYYVFGKCDIDQFMGCIIYPDIMETYGLSEVVAIMIHVNEKGNITKIEYDNGNAPDYVKIALKCVLNYLIFTPRYIDGEATPFTYYLPLVFK